METFLTILAGVLVYVLGQIVLQIWLEPLQQLKRAIVEVSEALAKHEGAIVSLAAAPSETRSAISQDMAVLSARLSGRRELIPLYGVARLLYALPSKANIQAGIGGLNSISNYVAGTHTNADVIASYGVQEAREALGLFIDPNKRLDPSRKLDFVVDAQQQASADVSASAASPLRQSRD